MSFLLHIPNLFLFLILSFVFILLSVFALYLVNRYIPSDLRFQSNAVIGSVSSLISIIYGVLVGLTALYLINNTNYTADAVQREANAIADLHRDTKWLSDPIRTKVHMEMERYLSLVINKEWPLMKEGKKISEEGHLIIVNMVNEIVNYMTQNKDQSILFQDILTQVRNLYDARQQRIHMSYLALNSEMWLVIMIGTLLTIMINFLFGMEFHLHVILVSAVAFMAASMLFLLLTLDRPFQGEFYIEPDPYRYVLNFIKNYSDVGLQNYPQQINPQPND